VKEKDEAIAQTKAKILNAKKLMDEQNSSYHSEIETLKKEAERDRKEINKMRSVESNNSQLKKEKETINKKEKDIEIKYKKEHE